MTHIKEAYTKYVLEAFSKMNSTPFIKEVIHDATSACVRRMINGKVQQKQAKKNR